MLYSMQEGSVHIVGLHFLDPESALDVTHLEVVSLNSEQKPKDIKIQGFSYTKENKC
jgi:hypothetical protein